MSKHTRGQWKFQHNNWEVSTVYSENGEVARCVIDEDGDELVKEANVRLISACPDMLEALQAALPIIEYERFKQEASYGKNFNHRKTDLARHAHDLVKSAIAKATEGEPG